MNALEVSWLVNPGGWLVCQISLIYWCLPSISVKSVIGFKNFLSCHLLLRKSCWIEVVPSPSSDFRASLSCCFPWNLNLSEESQLASVDTSHHACLEESPPVRWSSVIQRCGFVSIHSRALSTSRISSSRLLNSGAFCTRSRFLASFTALPDRLNCADF